MNSSIIVISIIALFVFIFGIMYFLVSFGQNPQESQQQDNITNAQTSHLMTIDEKIQDIENRAAVSGFDFSQADDTTLAIIHNAALDAVHVIDKSNSNGPDNAATVQAFGNDLSIIHNAEQSWVYSHDVSGGQ